MIGPLTPAAFNLNDLPITSIVVPLLGVLLIIVGMMMGIRKKRRRFDAQGSARGRVEELRHKQAVRGDLEQLMAEVEQLAKRFGTQLDAKTMQMERLIEEADQKIAELRQLEQARRDAQTLQSPEPSSLRSQASSIHPPSPIPHPPSPSPDDALKRSVCALADRGLDPIEIARQLNEHVGKVELILALRQA